MNITSNWPLPNDGIRYLTPEFIISELRSHPALADPYPLAMGYYPNAHQHHLKRTQHSNHLLMYCVSGLGTLNALDQSYEITAGTLICLPPGIPHEYSADSNSPWTLYWVHFDGAHAERFFRHMDMQSLTEDIGLHPQLINFFENSFELRRSHHDVRTFIHICHLLQALISLLSIELHRSRAKEKFKISIDKVQHVMHKNIHGQLNLDALTEQFGLSKYYFSKRFKEMTGQSPIQYFINMKMQRACQLLDKSQHSIKEIGNSLGYEDPYYFSRIFKKVVGLSPLQYRQSRHC